MSNGNLEQFYDYLTEDSEQRACDTIPDDDCTQVPRNFSLNIFNGTLSKLAEQIISPNLTLAWIMNFLGAPAFLIGMLVPIKNAGSLLPQLAVSGRIRSLQIRKNVWAGAALFQALCMAASGTLLYSLEADYLPWILAGLLLLYSMASGVASVAYKDVSAKTVPRGERGQMLSYRSTFGGLLALVAGGLLVFILKEQADRSVYACMFWFAGLLWLAAALIFYQIKEEKGATKGGRTPFEEIRAGASLIKTDKGFRNFLITRSLMMAIPLLQPFYVLLIKEYDPGLSKLRYVGLLIVLSGLAQVISSPFWGKLADNESRKLMRIASALGILGALYAISLLVFDGFGFDFYAVLPLFFLNGIAYSGTRLSRKTYLVDYAPKDDRPTYVSVANTFIGIYTLIASSFGLLAEFGGLILQISFFCLMLISVIVMSFQLRKT